MELQITRVASRKDIEAYLGGARINTAEFNDGTKAHYDNDSQDTIYIKADGTKDGPYAFRWDPTEYGTILGEKSENGFDSHPEITLTEMTDAEYEEWKEVMKEIETN